MNYTIRGHDLKTNSVEELARKTKEQGIESLQLALGLSFPELPSAGVNLNPGMGAMIKNTLAKQQVSVGILSCYINMIHPDLTIREELLQKFESYLRHAKYFGAAMVATETGNVFPEIHYTEENFTEEAFQAIVDSIQRLVKAGEQHQTLVGIEPGLNHPLYSVAMVERLLEEIPSDYLGIILDPTNLITKDTYKNQVEIVEEAFQKFGDKIVAIHLKDFTIKEDAIVPVNLGEGLIDYPAIIKIIQKHKPMSYVVLEETKNEHIGQALQLLESLNTGTL